MMVKNYEDQIKEYSDLILRKHYEGKLDKPTSIRLLDKIIEWGERRLTNDAETRN